MEENLRKKHLGDRKDAWVVRDLDPMHNIMNYLMGKRTENEAVSTINVEITELNKFLSTKNKEVDQKLKYTYLHAVIAALGRTINERKCLNYFVRNKKFYERKAISFCYVAKRIKTDGSEENVVIQEYRTDSDTSSILQIHDKAVKEINTFRASDSNNTGSGELINKFLRLPSFVLSLVIGFFKILDKHGRLPYWIWKDLPYYSTVFISNLGSIKFDAKYHHLTNFGTNSLFIIIGEKFEKDNKEYLPINFTIDERIADGVYFANSLKLFNAILQKPEILDLPSNQKIDYKELLYTVYGEKK